MINDNRTVIGFLVDDIYSDFAKELANSLSKSLPPGKNVILVVIAGMHDSDSNVFDNAHCYKMVYNSIYRLTEMCRIDGLIISMGSKRIENCKEAGLVKDFGNIPKVYVASDIEGEITVNYDNESGIREALNYIVNVNGSSNICMLGGRDDNRDSIERKQIFIKCLEENGLTFSETLYEKTNMSANCTKEAARLLDNNPDVQAIFCVNDDVARGLYEVMAKRNLVPGGDINVFGFDNTHNAAEMMPPLSSIGSDAEAMGQKSIRLLFDIMNGKKVKSVKLPTRLFGRQSLRYDMYEYTTLEMLNIDQAFIYRMFNDCFYRYRNDRVDRKAINLRRLFYEFISRMLYAMKYRYMDVEEFAEISRMIDVFFDNGAMEYTDAVKLIGSVEKLQNSMNIIQKSVAANVSNNRLFLRMKDRAIKAQAQMRIEEKNKNLEAGRRMQEFLIETMDFQNEGKVSVNNIIRNFGKLGLKNAAFYMYEKTVEFDYGSKASFPGLIKLMCVTRDGDLSIIPKDRQECPVSSIFLRKELSSACAGYAAFPVFYCQYIYGILVCELTGDILSSGEYAANQLGRVLYINT